MAVVARSYWPQSLYCQMDNTDNCGRTATCRGCNFQKSYFLPDQFFDRISEIFVYQMEERYGRKDDWKAVHNLLMEML